MKKDKGKLKGKEESKDIERGGRERKQQRNGGLFP
jgi:hypothetical protein